MDFETAPYNLYQKYDRTIEYSKVMAIPSGAAKVRSAAPKSPLHQFTSNNTSNTLHQTINDHLRHALDDHGIDYTLDAHPQITDNRYNLVSKRTEERIYDHTGHNVTRHLDYKPIVSRVSGGRFRQEPQFSMEIGSFEEGSLAPAQTHHQHDSIKHLSPSSSPFTSILLSSQNNAEQGYNQPIQKLVETSNFCLGSTSSIESRLSNSSKNMMEEHLIHSNSVTTARKWHALNEQETMYSSSGSRTPEFSAECK